MIYIYIYIVCVCPIGLAISYPFAAHWDARNGGPWLGFCQGSLWQVSSKLNSNLGGARQKHLKNLPSGYDYQFAMVFRWPIEIDGLPGLSY